MKTKILYIVFFFIGMNSNLFGQYVIIVSKDKEKFENAGNQEVLKVNIYYNNYQKVLLDFSKFMKREHKASTTIQNAQLFVDNAIIKSVSDNTVDIYAKSETAGENQVSLMIAVDLGGIFLSENTHREKISAMSKVLYNFALGESKSGLADKIKDAEKRLKELQKFETDLITGIVDNRTKITEYKNKIAEAELSIQQSELKITENKQTIGSQGIVISDLKAVIIK